MLEAGVAAAATGVNVATKAVDVCKKLQELLACVQGKGKVFESGKELLEKITVDLQSVLNSLDSNKEKTLYQEHILKLNEYLNRLVNEINKIVGNSDWKSKASHFLLEQSQLGKLNAFSEELEIIKSTLQLALTSQILRNQENTNEKLDKNQLDLKERLDLLQVRKPEARPTITMVGLPKGAIVEGLFELEQTAVKHADVVLPQEGGSETDSRIMRFMSESNKQVNEASQKHDVKMSLLEEGAKAGSVKAKQLGYTAGTVSMQQSSLPKPEKQRKKKKGVR